MSADIDTTETPAARYSAAKLGVGMRLAQSHHIGDAEVGGATDPNGPRGAPDDRRIEDRHIRALAQQDRCRAVGR